MEQVIIIMLIGLTPNGDKAPYTFEYAPFETFEACTVAKAKAEKGNPDALFYCVKEK